MKNKRRITITIDTFTDSHEANLAATKLNEQGIQTFLENENSISLNLMAGIKLKVFSKDMKKAFEILSK